MREKFRSGLDEAQHEGTWGDRWHTSFGDRKRSLLDAMGVRGLRSGIIHTDKDTLPGPIRVTKPTKA